MKFILVVLLLLSCYSPSIVSAHSDGKSITTINGKEIKENPIQAVQSAVFGLPTDSDLAPENYLVGQKIEILIDTTKLAIPQEIFEKTNFIWDFGDGTPKQVLKNGNNNSHTYTKPGTYIMTVNVNYKPAGFPEEGVQQIQATILHILPHNEYKLPKVNIMVNGKSNTQEKEIAIDLNNPVTLSAAVAQNSAKIVSYKWSFDDGSESDTKTATHRYKLPQYYATPVLRVTDENGFFIDEYVTIKNSGKNEPNDPKGEDFKQLIFIVGGSILITIVLLLFAIKFMVKSKKK